MERQSVFVSAVVYMHDDSQSIGLFMDTVGRRLDELFDHYEIIAVDDRSSDGSAEIFAQKKGQLRGVLSVVSLSFYQGVQRAMAAGVDLAIGDFVFEFENCIVDYEADLVEKIFNKALSGTDIVSAVPHIRAPLSSRAFYSVFNKYSGSQFPLVTERFRLVSRRAINRVNAMSDNITYRKAFYMGCGLANGTEIYMPHTKGATLKKDKKQRRELAIDSLILFTDVAYKISLTLSVFMAAFMMAVGIYTLTIYFLGNPIEGWTTTLLVLSFAFLGVFAMLTIVVKYLSILLSIAFSKTRYTIESVRKY